MLQYVGFLEIFCKKNCVLTLLHPPFCHFVCIQVKTDVQSAKVLEYYQWVQQPFVYLTVVYFTFTLVECKFTWLITMLYFLQGLNVDLTYLVLSWHLTALLCLMSEYFHTSTYYFEYITLSSMAKCRVPLWCTHNGLKSWVWNAGQTLRLEAVYKYKLYTCFIFIFQQSTVGANAPPGCNLVWRKMVVLEEWNHDQVSALRQEETCVNPLLYQLTFTTLLSLTFIGLHSCAVTHIIR